MLWPRISTVVLLLTAAGVSCGCRSSQEDIATTGVGSDRDASPSGDGTSQAQSSDAGAAGSAPTVDASTPDVAFPHLAGVEAGAGGSAPAEPEVSSSTQLPASLPSDCDEGELICENDQAYQCKSEGDRDFEEDEVPWSRTERVSCPLLSEEECGAIESELRAYEAADNPCTVDDDCDVWGGGDDSCNCGPYLVDSFGVSSNVTDEKRGTMRALFERLSVGGCRVEWACDSSPALPLCAGGNCTTTTESCFRDVSFDAGRVSP